MPKNIKPRVNLWIEHERDVILGMGRVQLLLAIEELGSLHKAAEKLGISYRSAWGKIKSTEEALGFSLVEAGQSRKDGYKLSNKAKTICNDFIQLHNKIQEYSLTTLKEYPSLNEIF